MYWNNWSIAKRLTCLYTLLTFFLLTVIVLFLHWGIIALLYDIDEQFVLTESKKIETALNHSAKETLHQLILDQPVSLNHSIYHYYIRILDNKKQVVLETPGMSSVIKNKKLLEKKASWITYQNFWSYFQHNDYYLWLEIPVNDMKTIQIALDLSYQHDLIRDYCNYLIIVLGLGSIIAIFLSYFITRQGMRSLHDLTRQAHTITAESLDTRIHPNLWPTELRHLGNAFNEMLERIETAYASMKQFSTDLAHELRTPINNMMGEIEVALTQHGTVKQYSEVMQSNLEELQQLQHVIENLLFLARSENPNLILSNEFLALHEELHTICDYYQAIADDKNITLTVRGQASVSANKVMMRRMFSNLLSNALQYTESEGRIEIELQEIGNPLFVRVIIRDNGIGIESRHLPRLFDRFYRVNAHHATDTPHCGLGLSIVKSIMKLHQGKIRIESKVAEGTTIILELPK